MQIWLKLLNLYINISPGLKDKENQQNIYKPFTSYRLTAKLVEPVMRAAGLCSSIRYLAKFHPGGLTFQPFRFLQAISALLYLFIVLDHGRLLGVFKKRQKLTLANCAIVPSSPASCLFPKSPQENQLLPTLSRCNSLA